MLNKILNYSNLKLNKYLTFVNCYDDFHKYNVTINRIDAHTHT